MQNKLKESVQSVVVAGDGRHDSMGHSAKYCAYTIFCCSIPLIIDFSLVQVCCIFIQICFFVCVHISLCVCVYVYIFILCDCVYLLFAEFILETENRLRRESHLQVNCDSAIFCRFFCSIFLSIGFFWVVHKKTTKNISDEFSVLRRVSRL